MDPAVATTTAPPGVAFQDGLGERRHTVDPSGIDTLEVLSLRGELTAVPSFEFALRERVSRLAGFRHAYFAHVRSVDRLNDQRSTLALVSDRTPGVRLSDILAVAEQQHLALEINAALCLIRQLVPAVATLHENARDVAHGAIGPERIVIAPNARLVIVEHVMGAALEQLRFSHDRYWKELRIALPRSAGLPRFDHRADVTQLGVVALSLILGRLLREDEYPAHIGDAVSSAWAISARGGLEPLPAGLRAWLSRTLQIDARNAFSSALEARAELDKVLGDSDYLAAPAAVEAFLAQYHAAIQPPPEARELPLPVQAAPSPAKEPPPPPRPAARQTDALPAPTSSESLWSGFESEEETEEEETQTDESAGWPRGSHVRARPSSRLIAVAVVVIALAGGGVVAARRYLMPAAMAAGGTGTLVVNTNPAGAQVVVDGEARGVTPLTLALKSGAHAIELRGDGAPRTIPITISAGAQMSQYIDLPKTAASTGQLQIRSEPTGAAVLVDGVPRGSAPITIAELVPGEHTVVLESALGIVKQTVTVEAGITASLVVPLSTAEAAPISGWISVSAPVDVQLYENKKLLGTSQSDRLMVSAGRHEIEIVNEPLAYRAVRTVQVAPGKVTPVKIDLPKGTIALNAIPWAEVWIDGEKVGETPIGNLPVTIGPHEIIFRHPDLGEQRQALTVTMNVPARVSVDLRKK